MRLAYCVGTLTEDNCEEAHLNLRYSQSRWINSHRACVNITSSSLSAEVRDDSLMRKEQHVVYL